MRGELAGTRYGARTNSSATTTPQTPGPRWAIGSGERRTCAHTYVRNGGASERTSEQTEQTRAEVGIYIPGASSRVEGDGGSARVPRARRKPGGPDAYYRGAVARRDGGGGDGDVEDGGDDVGDRDDGSGVGDGVRAGMTSALAISAMT